MFTIQPVLATGFKVISSFQQGLVSESFWNAISQEVSVVVVNETSVCSTFYTSHTVPELARYLEKCASDNSVIKPGKFID